MSNGNGSRGLLTHVVQRPFRDGEQKRVTGELVNALGWTWARQLEDQRYITPVPAGLQPVQSVDGRWWADRQFLRRYGLQEQRPATVPPIARDDDQDATPLTAWPRKAKGSWYELSDGRKVQGKVAAREAQAALDATG